MCDLCRRMDHGTDTAVHQWWPSPCVRFPHHRSPRYYCAVPISPKNVSFAGVGFAYTRQSWADAIDGLANHGAFRVTGCDIEHFRPLRSQRFVTTHIRAYALAKTLTLHRRTQLAIEGVARDHGINGPCPRKNPSASSRTLRRCGLPLPVNIPTRGRQPRCRRAGRGSPPPRPG
jgi:hypothetical protein